MKKHITNWIKDFVHNCIIHPVMPFLPVRMANDVPDWHANWAFRDRYDELKLEGKNDKNCC